MSVVISSEGQSSNRQRSFDEQQSADVIDMQDAQIPSGHEHPFEFFFNPKFRGLTMNSKSQSLREGTNFYMLFDTANQRQERTICDELDLHLLDSIFRSCDFDRYARIIVDVQNGKIIDVHHIAERNIVLSKDFAFLLARLAQKNQSGADLVLRTNDGILKRYRLYYLKPVVKQRKERVTRFLLNRMLEFAIQSQGIQLIRALSGSRYGYLTEGALSSRLGEAAKDVTFLCLNDREVHSELQYVGDQVATTCLGELNGDILRGVILLSQTEIYKNPSIGRTLSQLAAEQSLEAFRAEKLSSKEMLAFAISYKHLLSVDWRNRIGYDQNTQLKVLLEEVTAMSERRGLGDTVVVWSDIALKVRLPSRYKFWPRYGVEPYARFTSLVLTPRSLAIGDLRSERVWLYIETYLSNQSGGCLMLDTDGFLRRCRWRSDVSVEEALHNLAVHLLQYNILWRRDAAEWRDKDSIQSWAYQTLGMRRGLWLDLTARLVNVLQIVEADCTTLPVYAYREMNRTRHAPVLNRSWAYYLLNDMYSTWLAADEARIRQIDERFETVTAGYRRTFDYDFRGAADESNRSRITAEYTQETFFAKHNEYESFSLLFQRIINPSDPSDVQMYRVLRLTGRSYVMAAACMCFTAAVEPEFLAQILSDEEAS